MLASLALLSSPVAAGEGPEATVAALWRAMSNDAGASADTATLERLFRDDAVVFGGRYRDGEPALRRSTRAEFLQSFAGVQAEGFHECEVSRTVHAYDRFAVVYSVVESRADPGAKAPDFTGVNSIQLYRDGERWRIVSLYYHVQAPGVPVPLGAGRSGDCID